ncbi:MAG: sodium-dependent transporter [Parvibaculaceae bacterium]
MAVSVAREHWSSRFAFLMAAIGSAVGLGNIWRFPFVTGENGGGAFILIYLFTTTAIALPILISEIMLGRMGGQSPIHSLMLLTRKHRKSFLWVAMAWGGTLGAFVVLSYYSVIGGWALKYTTLAASGTFAELDGTTSGDVFGGFISDPLALIGWHTLFMGINIGIVIWGLHKGIERAVVFLMPLLFVLLIGMVVYAASTPGFERAVDFLFTFDFSKVTSNTFLTAIGQGFFSVSVALGAMMTYGAYLDEDVNIPRSAVVIALADTGVAILAGLAVFPLVFSFALEPSAGPGLIFVTVPIAFGQMDAGLLVGTMFFVLLSVAAVTSAISLLEPAVAYMEEALTLSRRATALLVGGACWALGIASVLSFNDWSGYYPLASFGVLADKTVFDVFDFVVTSWVQPGVGIAMAVFAGWALSKATVVEGLNVEDANALWFRLWYFLVRVVCPVAVLLVFASAVWPDFVASMMPS